MNLLLRLSDPGRVHPLSPVPPGLYAILAKVGHVSSSVKFTLFSRLSHSNLCAPRQRALRQFWLCFHGRRLRGTPSLSHCLHDLTVISFVLLNIITSPFLASFFKTFWNYMHFSSVTGWWRTLCTIFFGIHALLRFETKRNFCPIQTVWTRHARPVQYIRRGIIDVTQLCMHDTT